MTININNNNNKNIEHLYRQFGFARIDALEAGQTGTDCRGKEHNVSINWGVTGKRSVLMNGKNIHSSKDSNIVFEFSWTETIEGGNYELKVVAHAKPSTSTQPENRQYDFFVDGQSFFTFPNVYGLGSGLRTHVPRAGGRLTGSSKATTVTERSGVPSEYTNNNGSNNNELAEQRHRESVLAEVIQDGRALEHASNELQGDKDIVLTAVTQNAVRYNMLPMN